MSKSFLKDAVKVGHINKKVEEKLGVSFANDMSLYILEPTLDDFARDYPESYLSILEEIASSVRNADSFSYSESRNELLFLRLYPREGQLYLLSSLFCFRGKPKRWVLSSFKASKNLNELNRKEGEVFFRA